MIELGQRGDRALASAAAGALLDGHRGRDTEDGVDIGARCGLHELARVGVERFQIATLAFGEDNVECECALAAAGHASDHGEFLARNLHVETLEVVLARVVDAYGAAAPTPTLPRAQGRQGGYHCYRLSRDRLCAVRQSGECSLVALQRDARVRARVRRDLGRRSHTHHLSARVAALGTQIDDPVRGVDDVEVVLDHHQRMAGRDELPKSSEQLGNVVEVQPGGGFVEEEKVATCAATRVPHDARASRSPGGRASLSPHPRPLPPVGGEGNFYSCSRLQERAGVRARSPRKMPRQLESLCLSARQRGDRLAQLQVFEADVSQWP